MTTLATALAMLPLAWGIGHGADMLRPLAIGLIGALCISVLFSLIATPTVYCPIVRRARNRWFRTWRRARETEPEAS